MGAFFGRSIGPEVVLTDAAPKLPTAAEMVLREIRDRGDLPAMNRVVALVGKLAASEDCSVSELAQALLSDYAMSHKILRVVNSAVYRSGGEPINTISRAIIVLGWNAVRNIALTFRLFESMPRKSDAQLRSVLEESFLSAVVAREAAKAVQLKDDEQAFIGGLFHSYGRLLMAFYLPNKTEEEIGISASMLGMKVAEQLNFPEAITDCMRRKVVIRQPKRPSEYERMCGIAGFAGKLAEIQFKTDAPEQRQQKMQALSRKFEKDFGYKKINLESLMAAAIEAFEVLATEAGVRKTGTRRFAEVQIAPKGAAVNNTSAAGESAHSNEGTAADPAKAFASWVEAANDLSSATAPFAEELADVVATMAATLQTYDPQHILLFVRHPDEPKLVPHSGVGLSDEIQQWFQIALQETGHVFGLLLSNRKDLYIERIGAAETWPAFPNWYREHLDGERYVLVLPIIVQNTTEGLFYIDGSLLNGSPDRGQYVRVLRKLRDQITLRLLKESHGKPCSLRECLEVS